MHRFLTLSLLLPACERGQRVESHGDPPFELDSIASALWIEDPDNDPRDAVAALVLSKDEMGCEAIRGTDLYRDLDEAVLSGQGLLFLLEQDAWGSDAPPLDWEGLWMSGYSFGSDVERELAPLAFSDGFVWFLGGWYGIGGGAWLDIAAWATGGVSGSYSTEYWSGEFHAEHCGTWEEAEDTWEPWDSDWWDSGWPDSTPAYDLEVDWITYACDESSWEYFVRFIGWADLSTLDIHQDQGGEVWDESHDLWNTDYSPSGAWDEWAITLPIVGDWQDQVDGVNTLYPCEQEGTLTWMATGYEGDDTVCAVWGADPDYFGGDGCEILEF